MSTSSPSDDAVPVAERGQAFLHSARGLRGLSGPAIARIAHRLEEPRRRRPRPVLVRALATTALALTLGTAVAWASGALERLPGFGALFGRPKGPPPATAPQRPPLGPAPASAPAGGPSVAAPPEAAAPAGEGTGDEGGHPAPTDDGGGAPGRPAHRDQRSTTRPTAHRRTSIATSRPDVPPPDRPDSLIVREGASFARALELWRARRDAPAALAALDEHERQYAHGQMRAEALVLRAEILLAGRREREALAALDQVSVDQVPRGRELRTLRGELRARFGRCEEARTDLGPVARGADAQAARAREALVRCP